MPKNLTTWLKNELCVGYYRKLDLVVIEFRLALGLNHIMMAFEDNFYEAVVVLM